MVIGQLLCVRNVCQKSKKSTFLNCTRILVTIIDTELSTLYLTVSEITIGSLKL